MPTLTLAQKEAFLNEFKGTIFEYRLAWALAKSGGFEVSFLASLPSAAQARLEEYERLIWQLDPALAKSLEQWPLEVAAQLQAALPASLKAINWVGRQEKQAWQEADLLAQDAAGRTYPLSLKLSKDQAFVNTKSGGAKSFLTQYFSACPHAAAAQAELNNLIERGFLTLGMELYQQQNLGIFMGCFDERWILPHLPGQMPAELRPLIWQYYSKIAAYLAQLFQNWQREARFQAALAPIFGFGRPDLWQVNCFYQKDPWRLKHTIILPPPWVAEQIKALHWRPYEAGAIYFNGEFPEGTLQIRAKPMNVFTVAALKINCALRHRLSES